MVNLQASVPIRSGINEQNAPRTVHEPSVLPVVIPPNTIRPLAFRTLSKKHNLAFTSTTLQALATFIGKSCGSRWRQEGLADLVLDEVAKLWKQSGGGSIVEDCAKLSLKTILAELETYMVGGRVQHDKKAARKSTDAPIPQKKREHSVIDSHAQEADNSVSETREAGPDAPEPAEPPEDASNDRARKRVKVVNAFEQQRLTYNPNKKHFEPPYESASLLPPARNRVSLFRDRYYRVHQRLLRNETFQTSTLPTSFSESNAATSSNQPYKITSITSLQGRGHTNHLLLGLLTISPSGGYNLSDPSGTVAIDMEHAKGIPANGAWFVPGMILLVDGVYEDEDEDTVARGAGAIGGKFIAVSVGGPPCERREVSLGVDNQSRGWNTLPPTDSSADPMSAVGDSNQPEFMHPGSISRQSSEAQRVVIMGEVNLDNPKTLQALSLVLGQYDAASDDALPPAFILIGNFVHDAAIGAGNCGSIEYKEFFDSLASVLTQFPNLLRKSTFVFVPGENDPWASSFSPGATACVPRPIVPELFRSRVRRVFQTAYSQDHSVSSRQIDESAVWTSNPTKLTVDEPSVSEMVIFRDDISGRLRRNAVILKDDKAKKSSSGQGDAGAFSQATTVTDLEEDSPMESNEDQQDEVDASLVAARRLVKSILDQGYLSPFSPAVRPILWDYASALHLYPLPTALVMADPEADPFTVTYEGCHAMNPGRFVVEGSNDVARWIEFNMTTKKGSIKEEVL
ncbi:DNA polymerase epsilon subunit B [Nannizzia gypsea CBS 118893]|uniref:DNA polymerase epsilon subunit B n=1 Tax=Arthroderma gypseum (strain ATCC MYA-4604 / CBS 118893) TaxID=535722 RepID=E5QZ03_ARTGP|nr:DNA polymerase epsilon subunit B [Nannizzia gypsea CBS 118893]EFQ98912.1 DNA polymerase epsilon subunit B [Nannizzia gypsea CBS 118893]